MSTGWTPASKGNTFQPGDLVVFCNRPTPDALEVDHVETTRVFLKSKNSRKLLDVSAADLMLASTWKKIYGGSNS